MSLVAQIEPFTRDGIRSQYPNAGRWLIDLDGLVGDLLERWRLQPGGLLQGGRNAVVISVQRGSRPLVLKLSPDSRELAREVRSLQAFAVVGVTPAVVDVDAARGAVLMERLLPGHSLRDERLLLDRSQRKVEQLFWQLRDSRIRAPKDTITMQQHLSALLAAPLRRTGRAAAPMIPEQRRREAATLLERLVASGPQQLVHGALHPGNVLSHSGRLMVVDPRGMVGDPAYDVAELILKYSSELQRSRHDPAVADRDLRAAAEWAGDDPDRVCAWAEVIYCAGA